MNIWRSDISLEEREQRLYISYIPGLYVKNVDAVKIPFNFFFVCGKQVILWNILEIFGRSVPASLLAVKSLPASDSYCIYPSSDSNNMKLRHFTAFPALFSLDSHSVEGADPVLSLIVKFAPDIDTRSPASSVLRDYLREVPDFIRAAFVTYDVGLKIAREGRSPGTALFLATVFPGVAFKGQNFDQSTVARVYAALYADTPMHCLGGGDCKILARLTEMSTMSKAMFLKLTLGSSKSVADANMLLDAVAGPGSSAVSDTDLALLRGASLRDVYVGSTPLDCPEDVHPVRWALEKVLSGLKAVGAGVQATKGLPRGRDAHALLLLARCQERPVLWLKAVHPSSEMNAIGEGVTWHWFGSKMTACLRASEPSACDTLRAAVFKCTWSQALFLKYIVVPAEDPARLLAVLGVPESYPAQVARIGKLPVAAIHGLIDDMRSVPGVTNPLANLVVMGDSWKTPTLMWKPNESDRNAMEIFNAVIPPTSGSLPSSEALADVDAGETVYSKVLAQVVGDCIAVPNCSELRAFVEASPLVAALLLRYGLSHLSNGQGSAVLTFLSGIPTFCASGVRALLADESLEELIEMMRDSDGKWSDTPRILRPVDAVIPVLAEVGLDPGSTS